MHAFALSSRTNATSQKATLKKKKEQKQKEGEKVTCPSKELAAKVTFSNTKTISASSAKESVCSGPDLFSPNRSFVGIDQDGNGS